MHFVGPSRKYLAFVLILAASSAPPLAAQEPRHHQTLGGGLSYGEKLNKDADFWGWTIDYSRLLQSGWVIAISMAYDEETEIRRDNSKKVVQTYTPTFVWSYPLTQRWSLGGGFGKGLMNDDNKDGKFEFTKLNDDWAIGAVATFTLMERGRHRTSISSSLEQNLSDGDTSVSVDIGYAYAF